MSAAVDMIDVYILHDKSLTLREKNVEYITKTLDQLDFINKVHVVDTFDRTELINDQLQSIMSTGKLDNPNELDLLFEGLIQPINKSNISNYLKHIRAYDNIDKAGINALVLEDDVVISDNAIECFKTNSHRFFNSDADIIFFGQPFISQPEEMFTKIENFDTDKVLLPSCESYFIKHKIANKLRTSMLPIRFNTNVALSLAINKLNFKVFKMHPNLFVDGSKLGMFVSHISSNNTLLLNSSYNELYRMLQDKTDIKSCETHYENAMFKESPDFMYLMALCYLQSNEISKAKQLFDECFNVYCEQNCTLNDESSFMHNYFNFFRALQD